MQCYPEKPYSSSEANYSMSQSHSSSGSSAGGFGGHSSSSQYASAGGFGGRQGSSHHASAGGFGSNGSMSSHHAASHVSSGGFVGGHGGQQQIRKTSSFQAHRQETLTVFGTEAFCEVAPSSFPPGTDLKIIQCFNRIDKDGNGCIDDRELQSVLSSCNQAFSLRTVHLLMYEFTHSNRRIIGPREFVPLLKCLQSWKTIFQRFDRNRDGSIDSMELGTSLNSLGYCVSPVIVNLLIAKFTKSAGGGSYRCSLQYDQFIEACLTVKGLTETFKAREECGRASFTYEEFLLNVLPFIIA